MQNEYLKSHINQNVKITFSDKSEKFSGILLSYEDDCIKIRLHNYVTTLTTHIDCMNKFLDSIREINAEYVRGFKPDKANSDEVWYEVSRILSEYDKAVEHEAVRGSSDRMQEILRSSKQLYDKHKGNILAAQVHAFVLYITGKMKDSVKIYKSCGDFNGAFIASYGNEKSNNYSEELALYAVCCILANLQAQKLTRDDFARLMILNEARKLTSILLWVIDNVINDMKQPEDERKLFFEYCMALSWEKLGYELASWNEENLFSPENVEKLRSWLEGQEQDKDIISEAEKIIEELNTAIEKEKVCMKEFTGKIKDFDESKLTGHIECPEHYDSTLFFHFAQVFDKEVRRKLFLGKRPVVTFRVYRTEQNRLQADEIRSARTEEGRIIRFLPNANLPQGKILRQSDGSEYTFNLDNVSDAKSKAFLMDNRLYKNDDMSLPVSFTTWKYKKGQVKDQIEDIFATFSEEQEEQLKVREIVEEKLTPKQEDLVNNYQRVGLKDYLDRNRNLDVKRTQDARRLNPDNIEIMDSDKEESAQEDNMLTNSDYTDYTEHKKESTTRCVTPDYKLSKEDLMLLTDDEIKLLGAIINAEATMKFLTRSELTKRFGENTDIEARLLIEFPELKKNQVIQSIIENSSGKLGLIDALNIVYLGKIMERYRLKSCPLFKAFLSDPEKYTKDWENRFKALKDVRDALAHGNPQILSDKDRTEAREIVRKLQEELNKFFQ